jgi:phenylacetate-CoA ligase
MAFPLASLDEIAQLPFTTKTEIEAAVRANPRANLTFADEDYVRIHRTSGSTGEPLYVFDTAQDWQWWIEAWQYVLDAAEVTPSDRALMAFSFGPFVGFWSAADALLHRGTMVIPAGGLSTTARLDMLRQCKATIVCATPTYALRMAEVADEQGIDLSDSDVRVLIVAGEPGGSLPEVRRRLQTKWGAQVIDHAGASEVGPWGYGEMKGRGIYINENDFIAEFLPQERPANGQPVQELVLTSLGRVGWPLIRYRTGDLVAPGPSPTANRHTFLTGGILGRADEMVVIRGVNIFPSGVENVLRSFARIAEFRITATTKNGMDELTIEVESDDCECDEIRNLLQQKLGLRIDVSKAAGGSLPRSESKSRRFVDRRK